MNGIESFTRPESNDPLEQIQAHLTECEGFVDSLEKFDMMPPAITEQEESVRTHKLEELREQCEGALATIMTLIDALDPATSRDTLLQQLSILSARVSAH